MLQRQTDVRAKGTIPIIQPQSAPRMARPRNARNQATGLEVVSYGRFFSLPTCLLGEVLRLLMEFDLKTAGLLLSIGEEREHEEGVGGTWRETVKRMKCALRTIKKESVWVSVKNEEESLLVASKLFEDRIGEIAVYDNWESEWKEKRKEKAEK